MSDDRAKTQAEAEEVCGSPIERAILKALIVEANRIGWGVFVLWSCTLCGGFNGKLRDEDCPHCFSGIAGGPVGRRMGLRAIPTLGIHLQWQVGPHRVDFQLQAGMELSRDTPLAPGGWRGAHYVLECDGHDAHATREQRTADAQRDRYLTEHGYRVLRFTGSEIWRNPAQCASEALRILQTNPTEVGPEAASESQRGDA